MIEINKVYNENCLDTMKRMKDNFVDLTITSPPYSKLRDYNGYSFDFESIAKELYRVTKDGGAVVWVVGDSVENGSETGDSFRQALYFKEIGFNIHDTMIYKKDGISFPDSTRYYNVFEYMFIFSKGKPKTINLIKDRKNIYAGKQNSTTSREKDGKIHDCHGKKNNKVHQEYGVRFNVWTINRGYMKSTTDKIAYQHPAIFPEQLANDHIVTWTCENNLIYDPFIGSGTTAKMCIKNNRNYIGSEVSKEYCDITEERIKRLKEAKE